MSRKIVSISASASPMNDGKGTLTTTVALADDGTVWEYRSCFGNGDVSGSRRWNQLPDIPQDGASPTYLTR